MMTVFDKIIQLFNREQVGYTVLEHPPATTSEESAKYRNTPLESGAKALAVKINASYYILVLRACDRLDSKKLKQNFQNRGQKVKKMRFVSKEELFDLTGLVPGSVPPFGPPLFDQVSILVDNQVATNKIISFNAGSLSKSISMEFSEYRRLQDEDVFTSISISENLF